MHRCMARQPAAAQGMDIQGRAAGPTGARLYRPGRHQLDHDVCRAPRLQQVRSGRVVYPFPYSFFLFLFLSLLTACAVGSVYAKTVAGGHSNTVFFLGGALIVPVLVAHCLWGEAPPLPAPPSLAAVNADESNADESSNADEAETAPMLPS